MARSVDLEDLVRLLTLLLGQEAEFTPDADKQRAGLGIIVADRRVGAIYVLEVDDRVVGMASLLFTVSTALGGRVAIFEDFVLAPEVRGRGLGRLLLAGVVARAKRLKVLRLTLLTDGNNHRAQHLYAAAGFVPSEMTVMRRVAL